MKYNALFTTLLVILATPLATTAVQAQSVTLDGFYDANNASEVSAYSTTESVGWRNGHNTANDFWGDGSDPDPANWAQTTIRYGSGTLAGDTSGTTYFFLYVEAPLYAKGMEWSKDSSKIDDYWMYVLGGAYLHDEVGDSGTPHISKLDYGTATGSEAVEVGVKLGDVEGKFEEDGLLNNKIDGTGTGLIGLADSIDYLLANPHLLEDEDGNAFDVGVDDIKDSTSNNPNIPMAFEFQFDTQANLDAAVAGARTGIVLHLSPSKVPEPSSTLLLGLASIGMLLRRKR